MWKTARLRDLLELSAGGTPARNVPQFWDDGTIPWITTGEVNGTRIHAARELITRDGLRNSSAKIVPAGSILVAMIGQGRTRGQCSILEIDAATNQNCIALVPKGEVDSEFVYQYLQFSYSELRGLSNSSGQGNLNKALIGGFRMNVPPLAEQRKIAEILRTWDDAIDRAAQLHNASQQHLHMVREQLFRSSGGNAHWETKALAEVSEQLRSRSTGGEYPVMNISARSGFVLQSDKYSRDMAGESLKTYTLLHEGDFAYNKGNSLTYPQGCIFALKEPTALVPSVYFSFRLDSSLNPTFYEHYFAAGSLNRQLGQIISSGVRGNGLLNVTAHDFFKCVVPVPPRAEQDVIASALSEVSLEVDLLNRKVEALRTQKRGLMQKLLTGEIRVAVEERHG